MNLTTELIIRVTIIVVATDLIEYIHIKQHPEHLTIPFVLLVSLVTVVPIWISIWYVLRKHKD
jgi:heme/copper-type cytochrome/quinol oxidase subunit 4